MNRWILSVRLWMLVIGIWAWSQGTFGAEIKIDDLTIRFEPDQNMTYRVDAHELILDFKTAPSTSFILDTGLAGEAGPAFLNTEKAKDNRVLITRLGMAALPGARSLFDMQTEETMGLRVVYDLHC